MEECGIKGNTAAVALSGGTTPKEFFRYLSGRNKALLKETAAFFQVDERFVPHDHSDNNSRMIEEELIKPAGLKMWFPVNTACNNIQIAADEYEHVLSSSSQIRKNTTGTPVFDCILLGIGDDGHTASLFPETDAISVSDRFVIGVSPAGKQERISLTLPVLSAAENLVFLVAGDNKKAIMHDLFNSDRQIPVRTVIENNPNSVILCDSQACPG